MAQIIKHRRGSLESLGSVTGSLQKGELVIATGSANLSTTNGTSLVFAAVESGSVQATNRFLVGSSDPAIFSASIYNGLVKGVPYYASGSSTLFLLGSDGNEAINLVGNIQPFSGSVNTRLGDLEASIGGGASGIGTRVTELEASQSFFDGTYSGSVATAFSASAASVTSLSASAASALNGVSGAVATSISASSAASSVSVSSLSASSATALSASVSELSGSTASALNGVSGAFATSTSASNAQITALSASVASVTGDFSSSVATSFSASAANVSALSASIATTDSASSAFVTALSTSVDSRFDAIDALNATFATTGSNIFKGTQVITGSLYITNDLLVYGSSSLFNVTASALDIGDNTIVLNTATPAVRFGGISVQDSGSGAGVSGSLFWDSLNNRWLYQHPEGSGEGYNSAILISGPQNTGSLGEEQTLTAGYIQVATGEDHIGNSIMSQSVGKITLAGDLNVSGNISSSTISGIGNVSLYSQSVDSRVATLETSLGGGGSVGTRVANLETISSSYLAFTQSYYTDSSSFDTRISASLYSSITLSGSAASALNGVSGAVATSLSASAASVTSLSSSAASALNDVSGAVATSLSASKAEYTSFSASGASDFNSLSGSVSTLSGSVSTLSGSIYTQFSASGAGTAVLSASAASALNGVSGAFATSTSASKAEYTSFSASAASDLGTLSGSVYTQFSASGASTSVLSASAASALSSVSASAASALSSVSSSFSTSQAVQDGRLTTLEGSGSIQGVGTGNSPSFFSLSTNSDLVVGGNLVVQGDTVSLNATNLYVEDKLITLASGSNSSATSDGAGIEIAGTSASLKYVHASTSFSSSVDVIAPAVTASLNVPGGSSTKRIAFRNTNDNIDFVAAPTTAGDLVQWNGSDFVMSNTIDGGSF